MIRFTFTQSATGEDFHALYACETALNIAGFSRGSYQRGAPCGALFGDYQISKWRGMSEAERAGLHATFEGDGRNGPIILTIHDNCPPEGRAALEAVARAKTEGTYV